MSGLFISVHNEQGQGGAEVTVSGTRRANNCIHLKIWSDAFPLHRKRYTDARNKPCTLEEVFQLAEQCSRKMQEASLLGESFPLNLQLSINEISSTEVNEVTQGHWNNYNKKPWNKQDNYKGKKDSDKKPWYNKDQKPWNKDNKHQNKESKPIHVLL